MARTAQFDLFPRKPMTQSQRLAVIRRRLNGYEYRQAVRVAKRRRDREARERREAEQVRIEEMVTKR